MHSDQNSLEHVFVYGDLLRSNEHIIRKNRSCRLPFVLMHAGVGNCGL